MKRKLGLTALILLTAITFLPTHKTIYGEPNDAAGHPELLIQPLSCSGDSGAEPWSNGSHTYSGGDCDGAPRGC